MICEFTSDEKQLLKKGVIPQPMFDSDIGMGLGRALTAAVKTGLTEQLSDTFRSGTELAREANLNETAVLPVLDCLEALGYINKKKNAYAFSRMGNKFLSKDSPSNLINYLLFSEYQHYHSFLDLDKVLQSGRKDVDKHSDFTTEEWKLMTLGMLDLARLNVEEITEAIPAPPQCKKLLDLGGSHGLYSIYQCKKHSSLKAEVFDFEAVEPYLEQNTFEYEMQDQVSLLAGDFMTTDWDKEYDMIFAFNIIHGISSKNNQHLFGKAFHSLKKDGIFVILAQLKGLSGKSPLSRAVPAYMGLNLYIQAGGRTYGVDELTKKLEQVGFSSVQIKKLRYPGRGLVIGQK